MFYDLLHSTGQNLQLPRGKGHKRTSRSHTKVPHLRRKFVELVKWSELTEWLNQGSDWRDRSLANQFFTDLGIVTLCAKNGNKLLVLRD